MTRRHHWPANTRIDFAPKLIRILPSIPPQAGAAVSSAEAEFCVMYQLMA